MSAARVSAFLVSFLCLCTGCDREPVTPDGPGGGTPGPAGSGNTGLGDPLVIDGDLRFDPPTLVVDGVDQCGDPTRVSVRLVNDGDTAEIVENTISSCGCARIPVEPGLVVPAGGAVELPIDFEAWGAPRRKAHDVRLILEGGRLGPLLSLDVEIISPLRTIPSAAQRPLHPEGLVRVVAEDGTPFSVQGVEPAIPLAWSEGPAEQIELTIDWPALESWIAERPAGSVPGLTRTEDGRLDRMQVRILTDHPGCAGLRLDLFGSDHTRPVWNRPPPAP